MKFQIGGLCSIAKFCGGYDAAKRLVTREHGISDWERPRLELKPNDRASLIRVALEGGGEACLLAIEERSGAIIKFPVDNIPRKSATVQLIAGQAEVSLIFETEGLCPEVKGSVPTTIVRGASITVKGGFALLMFLP